MQAHRTRQFVVGHTFMAAIAFGALVSLLTLIVTLALTGDLPTVRQASDESVVGQPAVSLPQDRVGIGAGEGWIGSGSAPLEDGVSSTLDRADSLGRMQQSLANFDRMEQAPGLYTESGRAIGPGEGVNDYRFIEENTQLPGGQTAENDGLPGYEGASEAGY